MCLMGWFEYGFLCCEELCPQRAFRGTTLVKGVEIHELLQMMMKHSLPVSEV